MTSNYNSSIDELKKTIHNIYLRSRGGSDWSKFVDSLSESKSLQEAVSGAGLLFTFFATEYNKDWGFGKSEDQINCILNNVILRVLSSEPDVNHLTFVQYASNLLPTDDYDESLKEIIELYKKRISPDSSAFESIVDKTSEMMYKYNNNLNYMRWRGWETNQGKEIRKEAQELYRILVSQGYMPNDYEKEIIISPILNLLKNIGITILGIIFIAGLIVGFIKLIQLIFD